MAEKRIGIEIDPAAVHTLLATIPFASLDELIAALSWLKQAPHLESGTQRHSVSIQVDQAGTSGVVELFSLSRPPSSENFYGEEVNISYRIRIRGHDA